MRHRAFSALGVSTCIHMDPCPPVYYLPILVMIILLRTTLDYNANRLQYPSYETIHNPEQR